MRWLLSLFDGKAIHTLDTAASDYNFDLVNHEGAIVRDHFNFGVTERWIHRNSLSSGSISFPVLYISLSGNVWITQKQGDRIRAAGLVLPKGFTIQDHILSTSKFAQVSELATTVLRTSLD